jgi:hypothetical protein
MRVMILAKSSPDTEQAPPSGEPRDFEAMGRFTQELKDAGMLPASDPPPAQLEGRAGPVRAQAADDHRRAVHRVEGAGRRLLDLAGPVAR